VVRFQNFVSPPDVVNMVLYLLKHSIKTLIRQKTILFLIIVFSFAVSVFGILFYSGYFAYSYYDSLRGEVCNIEIILEPTAFSSTIHEILSNVTSLSRETVTSVIVREKNNTIGDYRYGSTIPVLGKYDVLDKTQVLVGRYFTENESDFVALLSEHFAAQLGIGNTPVGTTIQVGKDDYTLVGIIFNSENAYIIPVDCYIDHYNVTSISVSFSENVSQIGMRNIYSAFGDSISSYIFSSRLSPFLSRSFLPSLMQILLIYCFTLANVVLVILLWQKCNLNRYCIYYICGITNKCHILLIVLQIIAVSLFGILIGFMSYISILPLFESLGIVKASTKDYLLIVSYVSIFVLIYSSIYSLRSVSKLKSYKTRQ